MPVDPLTEEEMQIKEDKLELLGEALSATREKWIAARVASGVERRWIDDTSQYLGKDESTDRTPMMDTVRNGGYPTKKDVSSHRSTVFVNITRPKTNAVEARLANMLYPTDDLAWGIRPTPDPQLTMKALQQAKSLAQQWKTQAQTTQGPQSVANPTPAQVPGVSGGIQPAANPSSTQLVSADESYPIGDPFPKSQAEAELDVADIKAKAMQKEIEDAHIECNFVAEARKMLHDVAVLGTGVLKGPIVVNRTSKAWRPINGTKSYALEIVQEMRPASEHVSPWNIYTDPACGSNIHRGKGLFEKKNLTPKQVRDLVGQPGYLVDQIRKVLEQGPQRSTTMNEHDREEMKHADKFYEGWEFWGEFEPEELRLCGVDIPDDSPKVVSGCIIMINNIVVKGFLNPLECGSIPYDFMVLEKDETSPWGYGVPFLCRPAQRVLNAAWRQLMDNAGSSVGPMIAVKKNVVSPANGVWEVRGMKLWNCTDDSVDIRTAFSAFDIPNHSEEYERIINMAMAFADEETAVPKIMQGEAKSDSVGVTTIQMDSSNVVLGRLVKQYDDMITRPHIRRYYDFFMAYSDKDEIKGDFQVDARGSTVLLVRDQQIQALLQFGQFQGSALAPMVHWNRWLREVLKAQRLDPNDLLKSDAEIEKIVNQQPGPSPEEIKSQTAIQVAKIKAQADSASNSLRQQGELAYIQAQAQMARDNAVARIKELEAKRDLEILKYAEETKRSLDQVKADLAQTAMIEETKRQIAKAKIDLQSLEGDKNRVQSQGAGNGE